MNFASNIAIEVQGCHTDLLSRPVRRQYSGRARLVVGNAELRRQLGQEASLAKRSAGTLLPVQIIQIRL
jgi:hypothetical protein